MVKGVQKFSSEGTFINEWYPDLPLNVDVHDNKVFVACHYGIQIYDIDGQHLADIGAMAPSQAQGEFFYASGISIDNDGNIYVVDAGN